MKHSILVVLFCFACGFTFSQTPQTFKYQSVVRDASGDVQVNRIIALKASILKGSPTGTCVFSERHSTTTNDFGVCALNIGQGSLLSGSFTTVNWGDDSYFLKIELDINGGTTYVFMGTTQMLSVPYALYAAKSGQSAVDNDTSATNELQILSQVGNTITLSKSGGSFIDNDNQILSLVGNQLQISNGNSVTITGVVDLDADPTNELQSLSIVGSTLSISGTNSITLPPEIDSDTTNEMQTLSINGNVLKISKRNSVIIPPDLDCDTTNEMQTLSLVGNVLKISKRNSITLPTDNDPSPTNELQVLSYSNDTLRISNGNYIVLPLSTIIPSGSCINSNNITPPSGYTYSGNTMLTDPNWSTKTPTPNTCVGSYATLNGKIYIITWSYGGAATKMNLEYTIATNTWDIKTPPPTLRSSAVAEVANNKIYVIGGWYASTYSNIVEEYNPATDTWSTKAPMTTPRASSTAVSVNNLIYVIGGQKSGGQSSADVEMYDPSTNSWSTKASLANARYNHCSAVCNNNIYVFGGSATFSPNYVEQYNPTTNTWTTKSEMMTLRTSAFAGSIGDKIYVIGGDVTAVTKRYLVEEYTPASDSWKPIYPSLPTGRYQPAGGVYNSKIYIIGGYSTGYSNVNEEFNPSLKMYIHCKN